ncbi:MULTISPECIES: ClcB-like voltage-gated chloride channel protein [Caballeronia]|uniref:ClcB-like voltage-gated chloride channel protein n=1 Tax=Caballeronia TaxID=1827195 RepID=UPI00025BAB2F|nr:MULTISPECIES: ClcB-like voltage-gated chloride channel protein [Caballeronia]EKS67677.1 voltage-gated ClC-type chloride channel ClcB [Burkholderia sp. SJ98]MCG7403760.1 ClcB-like voltage-gated chloride channel protein [Caballeronia zhejiangensis]MCI1047466.1 ClcB-like voltage-gated chloride channel protein [Caballeronia zhejiangensis]MDR5765290.1 ClcB-like voltage-gated chloride channel protein [Caballeronia sp. LZ028]MDR5787231.1 ClcB-like voltage-gated chloride channel protein [Caballeron
MLSFLLKLRTRAQRLFRLSDSHTMLVWAVVVGVAGAFATSVFREGIEILQRLLGNHSEGLVALAQSLPWPVRVLLPAVGGLIAGVCLLIARKRASKNASTDYMEAVTIGDGVVPVWQSVWRSLSSLITISSGGSIGREGSMVQLAALVSSLIGRWVHFDPPRLRLLVACGAAAGITSAYNAPIAGAFFVTELVLGSMAMESFGPIVVSSVVANITMREFAGYRPPYEMPVFPTVTGIEVLLFVVLGLLCGTLAPHFLRLLAESKKRFSTLPLPLPVRLALGGLIVGVISIWWPEVWGNGYEVVNSLLHEPWTWTALLTVLVFKIIATAATAGSGAVGGIFTPTLFVGAVLGCLYGIGVHSIWPDSTSAPFAYAMVGMGAFLAAATHAPLMAILMIFEMTLSYQVMLPLMVSCVIAYFIARTSEQTSMYEVTLRRTREEKERLRLAATQMRELVKPADTVVPLSANIKDMTRVFLEYPVKYLYVVDDAGRFQGVVALKNITSDLLDDKTCASKTAADYLQPEFDVLTPDMSLGEALQHFLAFQGERLPVIEKKTQPLLLGVVYKTSLLDAYFRLNPTSR